MLLEKPLVLGYINGLNRVLFDPDYVAALTPRELESLKLSRTAIRTPESAQGFQPTTAITSYGEPEEVWGLGITLLAASTGIPIGDFYDYASFQVRWDQIDKGYSVMRHKGYSEELMGYIAECLDKDSNYRPSLAQRITLAEQNLNKRPWTQRQKLSNVHSTTEWTNSHVLNQGYNVQYGKSMIQDTNPNARVQHAAPPMQYQRFNQPQQNGVVNETQFY